ncbi:response regulator transcription factor [Bacillus sp. THAF10]|uniref:response regulator transcription factor n=1 Tax=Bacillus sp. THAF10 TaxID=2587848 RepID=UPI001269131E|nr:response regulator transcription factor [Bacillus sp. THAF10]
MKKILLIDDEIRMLELLSLYLAPYEYRCVKVQSGKEGVAFLEKDDADLILLDIMMPEMDGWETLRNIRIFSDVPIIMLTARNDKEDIVKGLKNGADDYIPKPFNEEELLARIEAVLRRTKITSSTDLPIHFKGLNLYTYSFQVTYKETTITLTPKEFALLEKFLLHRDKVFSREHLIDSIWDFKTETENRTIDSHIRNLRDKLRAGGFPVEAHLQTIWGVGYRWNDKYKK